MMSSSQELSPMTAKTALVTGANGGLGIHVTQAFLEAGYAVIGLAPKILQSDINHPNFTPLPAALVTGANGGLGIHVTQAFLEAGYAVIGLAPKILQSDINHPNFTPLPAA